MWLYVFQSTSLPISIQKKNDKKCVQAGYNEMTCSGSTNECAVVDYQTLRMIGIFEIERNDLQPRIMEILNLTNKDQRDSNFGDTQGSYVEISIGWQRTHFIA